MRRIGLAVILSLFLAPLAAEAQQTEKVVRVARLSPISASTDVPILQALREELRDRGWIEGQNIIFEYRFAEGNLASAPRTRCRTRPSQG